MTMKQKLNIVLPVILLAAVVLSACNAPAKATPTQAVDAIYTAAAQTVAAQAAMATATPRPTQTAKPTSTATATVTPTVLATQAQATSPAQNFCDNSIYVSDVTIPDNTELAPGQVFEKTWAMKNTGTCTWTEGYTIIFSNGDLMNGNTRPIGQPVPPQQQANVTVKLTAPNDPGSYTGWWRLANGKGDPFGQVVSVVIKVVAGSTATPQSATATPTTAPAASETSTATPTATVTPTP